jgi:hypothetical protein
MQNNTKHLHNLLLEKKCRDRQPRLANKVRRGPNIYGINTRPISYRDAKFQSHGKSLVSHS